MTGRPSANDYLTLASARVIYVDIPIISFLSVQETPVGWVCEQGESLSHPNSRANTVDYLRGLFPEGQPLSEWYSLTPDELYEAYQWLAPLVGSEVITLLLDSSTYYQFNGGIAIYTPGYCHVFFMGNPNGYSYFSLLGEVEVPFELPQNHILLAYGFVE